MPSTLQKTEGYYGHSNTELPFIVWIMSFDWFLIKVSYIIKVIVKENSFPWNLQRDECYNVESLENLYFKS